jgi:hypothetical protein
MGELDRSLLAIREDHDDEDLREQGPELVHPPKLVPIRYGENGYRIGFDGPPEPFSEIIQVLVLLDESPGDRLVNGRLESSVVYIMPARIIE